MAAPSTTTRPGTLIVLARPALFQSDEEGGWGKDPAPLVSWTGGV